MEGGRKSALRPTRGNEGGLVDNITPVKQLEAIQATPHAYSWTVMTLTAGKYPTSLRGHIVS